MISSNLTASPRYSDSNIAQGKANVQLLLLPYHSSIQHISVLGLSHRNRTALSAAAGLYGALNRQHLHHFVGGGVLGVLLEITGHGKRMVLPMRISATQSGRRVVLVLLVFFVIDSPFVGLQLILW